jgi:hypothetical protein
MERFRSSYPIMPIWKHGIKYQYSKSLSVIIIHFELKTFSYEVIDLNDRVVLPFNEALLSFGLTSYKKQTAGKQERTKRGKKFVCH